MTPIPTLSPTRALQLGASAWFVAATLGQWAFVLFILAFFGGHTLGGDLAGLNDKPHVTGYVPGDTFGNLQFIAHALMGGIVTFSGTWQLVPALRRRWPHIHRWNGRLFLGTSLLGALSGLYLTWIRGSRLGTGSNVSITLNGLLILAFATMAWRGALQRDFVRHRRHALRVFLLVNGVWFLRIGIMLAGLVLAPLGVEINYQGGGLRRRQLRQLGASAGGAGAVPARRTLPAGCAPIRHGRDPGRARAVDADWQRCGRRLHVASGAEPGERAIVPAEHVESVPTTRFPLRETAWSTTGRPAPGTRPEPFLWNARRLKMKRNAATTAVLFLLLAGSGPLTSNADARDADTRSDVGGSGGTEAVDVSDKATRKISMALGMEINDFIVTSQEDVESAAGSKTTQYTVRTSDGGNYKCQIIEPSRAGKFFSFGTAAGADALCTEFTGSNVNEARTASTAGGKGASSSSRSEPVAPVTISAKAAKKISMAIGEDTDRFVVTKQEDVESSAGMKGTEYTVRTNGGRTYKCQVLEPSRLGKLISFGAAGGADALCTDFTKGSPDRGKTNQANCNALLRAAHKCD